MDIKSLAVKLKALADRGDPGERELAQKKLDELMKKYQLTDEDVSDEIEDYFDIRFYHPWEQLLLWQIGYKVLNSTESYGRRGHGRNRQLKVVVFKCTKAQFLEIEYLFSFYRELFQRELDILLSAFIQKHRLFGIPDDDSEGKKMSDDDLKKMFAMMQNLDDVSPLKAIGMED